MPRRLCVALRLCFALVATFHFLGALPAAFAADAVEFRENDRITLLGGTFVERMQVYGQFETRAIAALGERKLTFRNLGWSGDTVWGDARAVFGGPQDGFKRLVNDTLETKPTLLLIQYGSNEAQAGPAGLSDFIAQYQRLLDALAPTKARLALLSPVRREAVAPPLPDPSAYNANVKLYSDAIAQLARDRGAAYVDLQDLFDSPPAVETPTGRQPLKFTENGLHPTELGWAAASERLLAKLSIAAAPWSVEVTGAEAKTTNVSIKDLKSEPTAVRFQAVAQRLPAPTVYDNRQPWGLGPDSQPAKKLPSLSSAARLRVVGLQAGTYQLFVDGQPVAKADASTWGDPGVAFDVPADVEQADRVRQLIYDKNVLYFHRYRPQNETYLFLFRKHEQGNNAVEIPQFDPLVAEKEAEIAKQRVPQSHQFELKRLP